MTNSLTKSNKRRLSISLYLNYLVHGIGLIILTQNMQALGKFWNVPIATVSYVISGVGIGRLLAYFLFGYLSDKFGRRRLVYIGIFSYMAFFIGIPFTQSISVAYLFAILAGVANSALDSGTYPTFVEMGGNSSASNVFIKAFASLGEFILPLLIATLEARALWYGWSFMLAVLLLIVNLFLLQEIKFPAKNQDLTSSADDRGQATRGKRLLATISLAVYGYTTMALMILFTQWITLFAKQELGYSSLMAHALLSLYSIGSISGVLVIFVLLKVRIAETRILVIMNVLSLIAVLTISNSSVLWVSSIAAFVFGFSAAGGVLQVALNLLLKMFPRHKGVITGTYFTFGSIATFTVPIVTGWLSKSDLHAVMNFDVLIGLAGTGLVIITAAALGSGKVMSAITSALHIGVSTTDGK